MWLSCFLQVQCSDLFLVIFVSGDACLQPAFSALSGGSFSLFQSAFPVNSQDPCERVMKPVMSSGNQVFFNPIPDSDDEFGDFCGPIQPASLPAMPENPSSIVKESHSDPMVVWDSPEPTPSGPNYHISLDSDILDVQLAWGTSQSDEFSQCVGTLPVSDLLLCDTIPEDSFQIVQREISTSLHATLADCDELSVTSLVLPSIMNQSTSICTDAGDLTNETDDFGDFSQASLPSLAFEEIISQRDENFIFNPIELQSACKVVSEELADNLLDDSVPFDDFQAAPDALGSARDDSWVAANFSGQDPWRDDEPLSGAPPEDKFQDEARKENPPAVDLWKEDPPAVDPWKEDPPAVDPWKEDLPDVDPWKEDPPAVDPWNEGPPAVDPWNEDPPVVDPWAEDPPVVCDDPPEVDPWGEDPPPVELWKKAPAFIDPWREDASEQDAEPEDDEFGDFAGFQTPAVDDEFDDDFDDFEVAPPPPATETVDTKHPHSVGGVGNAPAESQECRIQKLLSVIVPCDAGQIDSAPIDEDPPAPLITLCCSARGALWSYVKELESTPALSFQWRHSTAQQRLLASLKISSHPMVCSILKIHIKILKIPIQVFRFRFKFSDSNSNCELKFNENN